MAYPRSFAKKGFVRSIAKYPELPDTRTMANFPSGVIFPVYLFWFWQSINTTYSAPFHRYPQVVTVKRNLKSLPSTRYTFLRYLSACFISNFLFRAVSSVPVTYPADGLWPVSTLFYKSNTPSDTFPH